MTITTLKIKKKPNGFDKEKFLQEFDDTYESKAGFTQKKTFAPSTIGYGHGNCARYWYLAFNGADFEDTATPKAKAAMENGTFTHDRIQSRLSKMNKNYNEQEHRMETHPAETLGKQITHDELAKLVDQHRKEIFESQQNGEYTSGEDEIYAY